MLGRAQVKDDELNDVLDASRPAVNPAIPKKGIVQCWDPSSMKSLGELPAMNREEVVARIERSRRAQATWAKSSFDQRRLLLQTMLKYIVDNQETIARVSARDSGKAKVDAAMGEIMVTCEKLRWTINRAEKYLRPERRESGTLMPHKRVWVEWVPVGVVGAIVPWNYPFHNVFNPLIAALFSGNGFVVKVSVCSPLLRVLRCSLISAACVFRVLLGWMWTGKDLEFLCRLPPHAAQALLSPNAALSSLIAGLRVLVVVDALLRAHH